MAPILASTAVRDVANTLLLEELEEELTDFNSEWMEGRDIL
jgi:hypothetical protein